MNGLPYYKAYPRDFMEGTIGMPFELKGAYRLILDLIYMQGGRLPDDPTYICGHLGCSKRAWSGYRAKLIEMGKIEVDGDHLTNHRAIIELEKLAKLSDVQREKRLGKSKNKGLQEPQFDQPEPEPEPDKKGSATHSLGVGVQPADEIAEAVQVYALAAERSAWPKIAKLTDARRKALRGRLKDAGGIEGWRAAIAKAEASNFLCGGTGWGGFSFDWLVKQANFFKLMEGNYDNRSGNGGSARGGMAGGASPGRGRAAASIASIVAQSRLARQV